MKPIVIKLIDYCFQHEWQLTEAWDDSNSIRYLSERMDIIAVGRLDISQPKFIETEDGRLFTFFPKDTPTEEVAKVILSWDPDVIHMHGNHGWPQYPYYAKYFRRVSNGKIKMIFSPAGSSCGTPEFLSNFDNIIVNHPLQIDRMKTDQKHKIIVRRRSADSTVFFPVYGNKVDYEFVYVAGFVPTKQIPQMIKTVINTGKRLLILGDKTRTVEHYNQVFDFVVKNSLEKQVFFHDFIPQIGVPRILGKCGIFVWPNIKPENPTTTTNRSVIEALACGMPLLLGERAFRETEFVVPSFNGFLYNSVDEFKIFSEHILNNLSIFRANSRNLNLKYFSFEENFVNFYLDLYTK